MQGADEECHGGNARIEPGAGGGAHDEKAREEEEDRQTAERPRLDAELVDPEILEDVVERRIGLCAVVERGDHLAQRHGVAQAGEGFIVEEGVSRRGPELEGGDEGQEG